MALLIGLFLREIFRGVGTGDASSGDMCQGGGAAVGHHAVLFDRHIFAGRCRHRRMISPKGREVKK